MLVVLTVIILIVPMLIFFYKEVHMGHNEAHYKSEKFINVDTHDVMSHFFGDDYDIQNQTKVLPAEPAVSSSDKQVLMMLQGKFVDIMCTVNPEHKKNIVYEKGRKTLYMEIL